MPMPTRTRRIRFSLAAVGAAGALIIGAAVAPLPAASAESAQAQRLSDIRKTSAEAAIWGLAPEFVYRFNRYNKLITAPYNTIAYSPYAAQWNNASTNAGNASVIYLNSSLSLKQTDLVYTVPPSNGTFQMFQVLDAFVNTVADPGTRTTPSDEMTHFLVVGPESEYADKTSVTMGGITFPVISLGTNRGEILVRVLGDPNAPPSDPRSFANSFENVAKKYAMNTLAEFKANGYAPVYPTGECAYNICPASAKKQKQAEKWRNVPTDAVDYFTQVGIALKLNGLPTKRTGIGGTTAADLPSYVQPQPGFDGTYFSPSAGQWKTLKSFKSIGLTVNGFTVPDGWGDDELAAMQKGFEDGLTAAKARLLKATTPETNYWLYINRDDEFGTYANTKIGYLGRATAIYAGGFPNLPTDGFYSTILREDGGTSFMDGDDAYSITFTVPDGSEGVPADGILPPMAEDADGNLLGFWSLTLYQPDFSEAAAPFISQASVLNTAYSRAESPVIDINTAKNTITTLASDVGPLRPSTAIMFGDNAGDFGLEPLTSYYIAADPIVNAPGTFPGVLETTYTYPISTYWQQQLSENGTPIQKPAGAADTCSNSGKACVTVALTVEQRDKDPLTYGIVQPVSQLGSLQLESAAKGLPGLVANEDGSYTIWMSPSLPDGVPATNWIPTPSQEYLQGIYPDAPSVTSLIQPILRMYYAQPGDEPPSILPCPASTPECAPDGLDTTYVIPPFINHSK